MTRSHAMNRLITAAVAASTGLAALAAAPAALAYSNLYCDSPGNKIRFGSNAVGLQASSNSFPAGFWADGITDTVNRFNQNPSNFRYNLTISNDGVGRGNGQNEIWFSSDASALQGAPAIAYQYYKCWWLFGWHYGMDEVDVLYDVNGGYTATRTAAALGGYNGTGRPLQSTGIHELGHGGPLNHVNTEYNVMGTDFEHLHANGGTVNSYVGEDTADGLVSLYGVRSWQDVAVSHWKYSGASGEYSDHTKTVIRTTGGSALPTRVVDGETAFRVNRGSTYQVEFTYENNGADFRPGLVTGYYISSNNIITTADRRIAGASWDLGRGNVLTTTVNLMIPADLTPGRAYWVGVIIDENNAVAEGVESNNATYLPIWIN
jgi:hypothetical protein